MLTAIDIALENNQMRSLSLIIQYIIDYQNSSVFKFLFEESLIYLLEKGIKLTPLLNSQIFIYEFESEDWPKVTTIGDEIVAPYNGSLFHMRDKYKEIFHMVPEDPFLKDMQKNMLGSSVLKKSDANQNQPEN